jgi:hypothetical protein
MKTTGVISFEDIEGTAQASYPPTPRHTDRRLGWPGVNAKRHWPLSWRYRRQRRDLSALR